MTKRTNIQKAYVVGSLAVLVGLTGSRDAAAQEWLKDRAYSEGAGLRAGDFELHPGVGAEAGYDSNWFLRSDKTGANLANGAPAAPRVDAGVLRVTPSFSVNTLGPQRLQGNGGPAPVSPDVAFRAGIAGTYRAFIGGSEIRNQSSNLSGNGDFRLDILPTRPWSFAVFGTAVRTIQPNTLGTPDLSYTHDDLGIGGEIISTPHSGTLDMRVGYQLHGTVFEDTGGAPFDNISHQITLKGRWGFRPKTAFLYDGNLTINQYSDQSRQNTLLHDSTPLRARFGMTGLITSRLSFTALAGWGASFFRPNTPAPQVQQYDSIIGNAQLTYSFGSNPRDEPGAASLTLSSVSVGYNRDFQNSYLSDYYGIDRGYVRVSYFFANRVLINIEGGAGAIEYPRVYTTPEGGGDGVNPIHTSFTDARLDASVYGEYRLTSSFALNATFNYAQNLSNVELPFSTGQTSGNGTTTTELYDMAWKRFQAYIGVRFLL